MDTDEYEYLEKAVEEKVNVSEKPEEDRRRSHHSRKGEEKGSGRKTMDEEANVSDRREHRDRRERERDPNEYRDRDRDRERRGSSRSRRYDREAEEDRDMDRERRSSSRSRRHDREAEEDRDRDRGRRSSSRSRRHDKEAEVDRDRDRGRRSSSRSRRHDIEAKEEIERQSMSRSRRHEREDMNGERDMERERSRRSESRSRRYDKEVEHEMERARSRDRIDRELELEREFREKESRRSKEKKEVEEPEADPERDQRTVFAYQMPLKATERDVYEFFSQAGKVRDVRLIMDRISKRSKGVGYIEFYDVMSIQKAIQLTGQLLFGQPVMVKYSEAEKNLVSSITSGSGASGVGAERKLYVGNLHFLMNEEQLRKIFEAFGPVELVQLPLDMETGYCKGFGFVQFAQIEHAKAAQQSLNGTLEIAGRIIKVSSVIEHVGTQDAGSNATDFDDDDGGGLGLNAHSRALLMQKLDRTGTATSIVNGGVTAVPSMTAPKTAIATTLPTVVRSSTVEPIGQPSECILLKNMFDPKTETDPDFDLEIKEDVQDECSKFGTVRHIYVDKNSSGHVYLRFDSIAAAGNCQRAMHMRWFARRCISATFMMPHEYEAKFKGMS